MCRWFTEQVDTLLHKSLVKNCWLLTTAISTVDPLLCIHRFSLRFRVVYSNCFWTFAVLFIVCTSFVWSVHWNSRPNSFGPVIVWVCEKDLLVLCSDRNLIGLYYSFVLGNIWHNCCNTLGLPTGCKPKIDVSSGLACWDINVDWIALYNLILQCKPDASNNIHRQELCFC